MVNPLPMTFKREGLKIEKLKHDKNSLKERAKQRNEA